MEWLNCKRCLVLPGEERFHESVAECPIPLDELWPPVHLSPGELRALDEQLQRIVAAER